MTNDVVIRAEGLSKKYVIGHEAVRERYVALRDVIARTAKRFARSTMDMVRGRQLVVGDEVEEIWALKDVSFEMKRGDVVGVIGRNGAGKSTLLKILSRITEPSAGRVEIRGRVSSLLEVGTGFHPELTGRENIYLNGAILGMTRSEIKGKFDEIVAFAEVEKFLDTPVKRYSTGMHVRLAFAVAAHLEPEILIVDEVLAVGDAQFQRKCLGKIKSVSEQEGRTVIFVSHNMGSISQLCSRGLLLRSGTLAFDGETTLAVGAYLKGDFETSVGGQLTHEIDPNKIGQMTEVTLRGADGKITDRFSCDEPIKIEVRLRLRARIAGMYCWIDLTRQRDGNLVWMNDSHDAPPNPLDDLNPGEYLMTITLPARSIGVGDYTLTVVLTGPQGGSTPVDGLEHICLLTVEDLKTSRGNQRPGHLSTIATWRVDQLVRPEKVALPDSVRCVRVI